MIDFFRTLHKELSDIHSELVLINEAVKAWRDETKQLRQTIELLSNKQPEGGLPDDFPFREELHQAGFLTMAQIPHTAKRIKATTGLDHEAVVKIDTARRRFNAQKES